MHPPREKYILLRTECIRRSRNIFCEGPNASAARKIHFAEDGMHSPLEKYILRRTECIRRLRNGFFGGMNDPPSAKGFGRSTNGIRC